MLLASIGSVFFGISGVLAQILFQSTEVSTAWLVNLRMTGAGVILLIFLKFRHYDIGTVWKQKYLGLNLIMFGIFGVLFAQSSFLKAVYFGNAAIAPILQSLGPMFVVFLVAIIQHERPNRLDLISNAISLVGIFLLITNGNLQKLYVSPQCIMWGIFSAIGVAAYTLLPRKLLANYSPLVVVGWGLTIGGLTSNIFTPIWKAPNALSALSILLIVIIVIIGTLLAYAMYISSLKFLKPCMACILGTLEPITATLITVIFLKESFYPIQWLGGSLTIVAILLDNLLSSKQCAK